MEGDCSRLALLVLVAMAAVAGVASAPPPTPPLPLMPLPSYRQLRFQRQEQVMFFHFGVNTFAGNEQGDGTDDPSIFNPHGLVSPFTLIHGSTSLGHSFPAFASISLCANFFSVALFRMRGSGCARRRMRGLRSSSSRRSTRMVFACGPRHTPTTPSRAPRGRTAQATWCAKSRTRPERRASNSASTCPRGTATNPSTATPCATTSTISANSESS
jgi:hypothetical protein